RENDVATHLYYIAREAANNALKHARPRSIHIRLSRCGEESMLCVEDDGSGFDASSRTQGMGLQIMRYRAKMVGGALGIQPGGNGGTPLCSRFPAGAREEEASDDAAIRTGAPAQTGASPSD